MQPGRRASTVGAMVATLALLASACGSGDTDSGQESTPAPTTISANDTNAAGTALSIDNNGGAFEGHTPRGFAGSGTGLFTGDNLNPRFPNGDGVQIWLTFELPPGTQVPSKATLSSGAMSVAGSPFADLGQLRAQPVTYESFGPPLFDLEADGPGAQCQRVGDSGIECDVTESVGSAIRSGRDRVQFRVRFDDPGDGDGEPDLAMFFLSDSNTNQSGVFTLELN